MRDSKGGIMGDIRRNRPGFSMYRGVDVEVSFSQYLGRASSWFVGVGPSRRGALESPGVG